MGQPAGEAGKRAKRAATTHPMTSITATAGTASDDRQTDRLIWFGLALTFVMLAARLAMTASIDLLPDEVYYWLWSEHLQPAYFDHPPAVSWFIWIGTALFGDNEFGVRFVSAVSVSLDSLLLYAIAKVLTESRRIAAWAMILSNVTALAALSVSVVPDQPLLLFWLISFYGMARIAKGGSGWWWLLVGVAGGLATMAKLTALFMALAVPLWAIVSPPMRRWFRSPWPYLALVLAVAVFMPALIWNAQNDWTSFTHQLNRPKFESIRPYSFVQYLTLWPAMVSPPILVLAGSGAVVLARRGWRNDPVRALLLLTPVPLFLYFSYHSLHEWIGAHWFSTLVMLATIFAAIGIEDGGRGWWRKVLVFCRRIAVPLGVIVVAGYYFLLLDNSLPFDRWSDYTRRFRGWDAYAQDQERVRSLYNAAYILGPDYSSPSYIRFYIVNPPPAYQLGEFDRWATFEGIGTAPAEFADRKGIYIGVWSVDYETAFLEQYFNTIERVGDVIRPFRPGVVAEDPVWLVSDPKPAAMPLFGLPGSDEPVTPH